MQPASCQQDQTPIVKAFREYCGADVFDRFVKCIDDRARHTARLQYWQERLWNEFASTFESVAPTSPVEIAALFGFTIPRSVIRWTQLVDDQRYVLDLVQTPSGTRYMQPRIENGIVTPHTVFTSAPTIGRELRLCESSAPKIRLENGEDFGVIRFGIWITKEEIAQVRLHRLSPIAKSPWVTEKPPNLPTKTKWLIEQGLPFLLGEPTTTYSQLEPNRPRP